MRITLQLFVHTSDTLPAFVQLAVLVGRRKDRVYDNFGLGPAAFDFFYDADITSHSGLARAIVYPKIVRSNYDPPHFGIQFIGELSISQSVKQVSALRMNQKCNVVSLHCQAAGVE
jgi:hypothetical protein